MAQTKWINSSKLEHLFGTWLVNRYVSWVIDHFRPDLTLVNKTDSRLHWLRRAREYGPIAMVYQDYNVPLKEETMTFGQLSDFFYLSNADQLQEYRSKGVDSVRYLVRGCSRDAHYPVAQGGNSYRSEVAFIGKPRDNIRRDILQFIDERFDLKVWGPGWDPAAYTRTGPRVRPPGYRKICSSARIVLGSNDGGAESFDELTARYKYMSNRDRFTMGCGGFLLTNDHGGVEEEFNPGEHLATYGSLDELGEQISYYLNHPGERKSIARKGCTYVHTHQTFDHFVDQVIEDVRDVL